MKKLVMVTYFFYFLTNVFVQQEAFNIFLPPVFPITVRMFNCYTFFYKMFNCYKTAQINQPVMEILPFD